MRWDTLFSVFDFEETLNASFFIEDILEYFYNSKKIRIRSKKFKLLQLKKISLALFLIGKAF